jgi:hypothetical protein
MIAKAAPVIQLGKKNVSTRPIPALVALGLPPQRVCAVSYSPPKVFQSQSLQRPEKKKNLNPYYYFLIKKFNLLVSITIDPSKPLYNFLY